MGQKDNQAIDLCHVIILLNVYIFTNIKIKHSANFFFSGIINTKHKFSSTKLKTLWMSYLTGVNICEEGFKSEKNVRVAVLQQSRT